MSTVAHPAEIEQLRNAHTARWEKARQTMREAGLSSPALEEFIDLAIELITEADDPEDVSFGIADLIISKVRA